MAERIEIEVVANTRAFDEAIKGVQAKLAAFGANVARVAADMRSAFTGMSTGFRDVGQSAGAAATTVSRAQSTIHRSTREATGAITQQRIAWAALGGIISHWAVSATRAITGGMAGLAEGSKKLETAVANIGTLVNKSVTDLSTHRAAIREISVETGKSAEDIAKGVYEAVSSGVELADSLEFTRVAAKAALAGLTDTGVSVRALTVVQNTYGASAGTTQQIADKLFQTVNVGVITFEQLASNIGKAATSAKLAGVPFNEFLGAIATLTKGGLSAASSLQGINALTNALANPQKRAAEFAKQHGINLGQQRIATEGLVPIMRELNEKLGSNFEQWRKLFPQQNAARAAMILASDAAKGLASDIASVSNASGALGRAAEIQSATVAVAFARLQSAVAAKFDELWQAASPTLIAILDELRKAIAGIDMRAVSQTIESIVGGMRDLLAVTKDLRDVFKEYVGYLFSAAKLVGRAAVMPLRLTQQAGEAAASLFDEAPAGNVHLSTRFQDSPALAALRRREAMEFGPPVGVVPTMGAEATEGPRVTPQEAASIAAALAESRARAGGARGRGGSENEVTRRLRAQEAMEQKAADDEARAARDEERLGRSAQREVEQRNAESVRRGEHADRREMARRFAEQSAAMDRIELSRLPVAPQGGGGFFGSLVAGVQQGQGVSGVLGNIAVTVGAALQRAGNAVGEFLVDGAKAAGAAFIDLTIEAGMFLVNEFGAMVGAAGALRGGAFVGAIQGRFQQARDFLQNIQANLPVLFRMLEPFIREIGPKLAAALPVVTRALVNGMPMVIRALIDQLPMLLDAVIESLPVLITGIVGMMPMVVEGVIAAVVPRIPDLALAIVTGVIDAFVANIDRFIVALAAGIAKAFAGLVDKANPLSDVGGKAGRVLKAVSTGGLSEVAGWLGFANGGMVPMLRAFDVGGMVNGLAQKYGHGATPIVAHRGEAVITRDAWSRIEARLEEAVSRGTAPAAPVVVQFSGRGDADRIISHAIERAFVMRVRQQGGTARTAREVADGAGVHTSLPKLVPIT